MSKNFPVCINVTPSLSHLEMVQFDYKQGVFWVMDNEPFAFDKNTREMEYDAETLQLALKRLYTRNKVPLRTPTFLVLPSYFTRQFLPADNMSDPAEIESKLISEVERFYVFKSVDPKVGYAPCKGRQLLYTAYPLTAIQSIESVFAELKIPLITIDCNYTAILRGLVTLGLVEREVAEDLKWSLVVLSDSTIFMSVIEGQLVEKVLESPIDMSQTDTFLKDIAEDFKNFCGFEVLNKVVIVNNSQKIYSTQLLETLEFDGPKDIFDQNPNTLKTFGNPEAAYPSSLEAVGGALIRQVSYVPPLNLSSPGTDDVGADDDLKNKIAIGIGLAGALFYGANMGVGQFLDSGALSMGQDAATISGEISQSLASLGILNEAKTKFYVKKALDNNTVYSNVFIKLIQALPPDAWINEVQMNSDTTFKSYKMDVKGFALTSGPVNNYLNEIKAQLPAETNIVPSIKPITQEGQRLFEFEFSTAEEAKT